MPNNNPATLKEAEKIATVWKESPDLIMGNLKYDDFAAIYDATSMTVKECLRRDAETVGLKKYRDDQIRQLQDLVTRFRSIARAHFGPDSKQYAQAGGTPLSNRKAPKRKAKADSESAPPHV